MHDLLAAFLLAAGGFLGLSAAVGLIRFPDVYARMHAASKAGTLGVSCLFVAAILHFATFEVAILCLLGIGFFMLTAPISAHLLARAAYRAGAKSWPGTTVDHLSGSYDEFRDRLAGYSFESEKSSKD